MKEYKYICIRLEKKEDEDILTHLGKMVNKERKKDIGMCGYIKRLIREDIAMDKLLIALSNKYEKEGE